jgi:DNA mismatch repair protein MutS2
LIYGSPGRSLALEIAGRLGLNPSVVAAARQNLGAREAQLAEHLAKLDRDMRAVEHEQRLAARERETLSETEGRMRQREEALRQREETFRRRLTEELDAQMRQARREIDDVIADLKAKTVDTGTGLSTARADLSPTTGEIGAMKAAARAAVEAVARRTSEAAGGHTAGDRSAGESSRPVSDHSRDSRAERLPEVGDRVVLSGLGLEGIVTAIHDGSAELDVRGKRMRASLDDLRVVAAASGSPPKIDVHVELQPREAGPTDLNVIGCSVDEAIARAERFLDESLLTDQRVVRLIHGYGTGQLKRALTGFLQQHPLVARIATAPPDQGGGGVTVVELKE